MILVVWTLILAVAAMAAAPQSRLGRGLRRALIECPAALIDRFGAAKLITLLIVVGVVLAVLHFASQFAPLLAGMGDVAPILAALVDGSLTLDILAALALTVASGSLKALWRLAMSAASAVAQITIRTVRLARRRPRDRRSDADKPPARPDDSSPEPGCAFA